MADEVIVSRSVPIPSGRQLAENSLSVTFASDQPAIPVVSGADMPSETGTSMFGFQVTEQRQFLLQELPTYGINGSIWTNRGNVVYDPSRSCVELSLSGGESSQLSTHQSAFAYKYQPGKEICTSQAVQAQIGPIVNNVIQQWGEFTKRDGYGWRVLTQQGTGVTVGSNTVTPWHNYLCFFRRTSAIPENYTTINVTSDPTGINSGGNNPILLGTGSPNKLYRPAYLVGNGADTTYIESGAWEDIVFTTLKNDADSNQVFNRDRLTNLDGDGKQPIDGGNRENSAKEISTISLSFSITNITANAGNQLNIPGTTNTFGTKTSAKTLSEGWIRPGMSLRIEGNTTYSGFVTSISGNTLTVSPNIPTLSNATIYINELANLCMFLIQRSWYGGAGGKGLVYIPDRNPPFVGSTRWVSAHETRIGDTLPVPSMSNPDQPITYQIGRFASVTSSLTLTPKLRRFGVSVWINGGDPRPVLIESAGSGSPKSVSNTAYTPIMAIAVKPFVWNSAISAQRPQKSRVYPYKLYASSGGNPCEIYLSKINNISSTNTLLGISNTTWYTGQQSIDNLRVVANLSAFTGATTINVSADGYPTGLAGKQIGPFYCGTNEGIELDLTDIFDPQRELLGRAENVLTGDPGDVLLLIARCLNSTSGQTSNVAISLVYGVQ